MLVREDAQTIKTRQPCGEIENNVEIFKRVRLLHSECIRLSKIKQVNLLSVKSKFDNS